MKWTPGLLSIYLRKLEIPVEKANGSCHSFWEGSENMRCNLRWCKEFVQQIWFFCGKWFSHHVKFYCKLVIICTSFLSRWFVFTPRHGVGPFLLSVSLNKFHFMRWICTSRTLFKLSRET